MATRELFNQAKKAISSEKPHSAVTDWIERLCGEKYGVDDYDGLIELIESINLQPSGPTEASRAIRKKLKYGSVHRQLRALTILKALVENCGQRFQTTFANERLVDRIKIMAGDPLTDETVKKKLYSVLISWHHQFVDEPKMSLVASLYPQVRGTRPGAAEAYKKEQQRLQAESRARQSLKEAETRAQEDQKRRMREEKERAKQRAKGQIRRPPFDLQKERPTIMATLAQASQCTHSLVNALQHVNRETESVTENVTVQDYLARTKLARRHVVRYIQLVDDDPTGEMIGTLISINETIVAALQLYDKLCKPAADDSDDDEDRDSDPAVAGTEAVERGMSNVHLGEVDKLQIRQRMAVERHASFQSVTRPHVHQTSVSSAHADLADLDFHAPGLQMPLQPGRLDDEEDHRGNLSDYSDYDSSEDEASHVLRASASNGAGYSYKETDRGLLDADIDDGDPFADPDPDDGVGTPGIIEKPRMAWTQI